MPFRRLESRTAQDDDSGRPLKRIKLEESEICSEADVGKLNKPYLAN